MDLKKKKIIVTGGSGFLGKNILAKLLACGVNRENIFAPRSEELDLRERKNCLKAAKGSDLVIHLAGMSGNPQFHSEHPAEIFYNNLIMGVELMEAARKAGAQKFVTIGSATEYPANAPLPYKEKDIWTGPPQDVHASYTTAKKMLLVQGAAYRKQYGLNVIHLLPTNMYGPGDAKHFVIPMLIGKVQEAQKEGKKFIEVWGTGKPTRDFLYISDAAGGVILAAEKYDKPEPLNLGSGFEISIKELAELIAKLMDFRGEIRFDKSKPDGEMKRLLDASSAEKEIGFKAKVDLETGLRQTINSYES